MSVSSDHEQTDEILGTEPKTLFETIRETITSPFTAISEKVHHLVSNEPESEGQDQTDQELQVSSTNVDRRHDSSTEETSDSNEIISSTDETESAVIPTAEDREIIRDIVDGLISSAIQQVLFQFQRVAMNNEETQLETLSSESDLVSPITVLAVDDRSTSSQGTIQTDTTASDDREQYDLETLTSEMTNVTWTDLVGDQSSSEPLNADRFDSSNATVESGISGSSAQV